MQISAKELANAVSGLSVAFGRSTEKSEATYGKVLFEISKDTISMLASDGIVTIKSSLSSPGNHIPDRFIVDGAMLRDVISKIDRDVKLHRNAKDFIISAGKERYTLITASAVEYPIGLDVIPQVGKFISVNRQALSDVISKCSETISVAVERGPIYGMSLKVSMNRLVDSVEYSITGNSLDGHRATNVKYQFNQEVDEFDDDIYSSADLSSILTLSVCQSIQRLISAGKDELVEIATSSRTFLVKSGNVVLSCSMLDGIFPDLSAVFNKQQTYTVVIGRDVFLDTISKAYKILTNEPRVTIEVDSNLMTVEAKSEKATMTKVLECKSSKEPIEIYIACKYVDETIKCFKKESDIRISVCGHANKVANGPVIFQSQDYPQFTRVIMPLKKC